MDTHSNTTAPHGDASLAAFAAVEFDAWTEINDGPKPPTNTEFAALGEENLPYVRLAWLTMFKTKAEIVAMFEADPDLCMRLTDDFEDAREWFDSFATLLSGARARMLIGAAAADVTSRGDAA